MIKKSVSGRLALMFAVASVLMASVFGFSLRVALHQSLESQMHNELLFRDSLMKPWISARTGFDDWQAVVTKVTDLSAAEGGRVRYWVLSEDPLYRVGGQPPAGVDWSSLASGFNQVPGLSEEACALYLLISDIPVNGDRPALRFVVAIDSTPYMGTLNEFTRALLFISVFSVLLVALLGYFISKVGMRPINSLSDQAQRLAPGKYGQRLDAAVLPEELKELAVSFNGVLERQEVAWMQLESFNADVAHELKTPLTNLIGETQLALSRERGTHELVELLESNLEELERMTSIVNDMLFLSHAQSGVRATQLKEVSLREEAFKTVEYVEPLFQQKNNVVTVEGDGVACIDRQLFHRSLANLLDNSSRHAIAGTAVTVSIATRGPMAVVSVANHGEPIAEEHLKRLFERFYRVDGSRAGSDTHHGLGLSIVKAVATMHKGDVFANSLNGVNTFGLTLAIGSIASRHATVCAAKSDVEVDGVRV